MMPNLTPLTVLSMLRLHNGAVAVRTDFGQYVGVPIGVASHAIEACSSATRFCVDGMGNSKGTLYIEVMPK
jgi:hypothetical protein